MVDHALRPVSAHDAAAQGVNRDQVVAEQFAGNRVLDVGSAGNCGHFLESLVDPLENRLLGNVGPVDAEAVILQAHLTRAVVVRHHQKSLG